MRQMQARLRQSDILHADETRLHMLQEPGKTATSHSYMWLYRSGRTGPEIICFEYQPSRNGGHYTWGQNLMYHPHLHVFVPGVGLDSSSK